MNMYAQSANFLKGLAVSVPETDRKVSTGETQERGSTMMPSISDQTEVLPCKADAERDVDAMLAALGLQMIRRYMNQHHWHDESRLAQAADDAEPGLKLENVAAHSWHVADAALLLASNFPEIDAQHALVLAIVHDKLELFTGDFDPVGSDGQGAKSHAFDPAARAAKTNMELAALDEYLSQLRISARDQQRDLFLEAIYARSAEAKFMKAVDKLQALAYVLAKKEGRLSDAHLNFSIRYSHKAVEYFPRLRIHYLILIRRLLEQVATQRRVPMDEVISGLPQSVLALALNESE